MEYDDAIKQERTRFHEEGQKYRRLVQLARRVHQPTILPLWNLKITTADSEVKIDRLSFLHSWTRTFYNAYTQYSLYRRYGGHNSPIPNTSVDGGLGLKETDGTVDTGGFTANLYPEPLVGGGGYGGDIGDINNGFIAGTGTTAESFDDFVVESIITHGAGGGQMSYAADTLVKGWDAGDRYKYAQWSRALTNSSGGTITVGNVGMVFWSGPGSNLRCFTREVLSPAQDVLDTEILTFTHEFRMYFP